MKMQKAQLETAVLDTVLSSNSNRKRKRKMPILSKAKKTKAKK